MRFIDILSIFPIIVRYTSFIFFYCYILRFRENSMVPFSQGRFRDSDFRPLIAKKDSNGFAINNKMFRYVCNRNVLPSVSGRILFLSSVRYCTTIVYMSLQMVTARVDVKDFDTFTEHDLMEQFDCRFPFRPFRNGSDFGDGWSETLQCDAIHQPTKIRLYK